MFSVVAINGSPQIKSRTGFLLSETMTAVTQLFPAMRSTINLAEAGGEVLMSLRRNEMTSGGERLTATVEEADLLIIGTPVYGGSYTGLLKHFLDLLNTSRLCSKPAIIVANGDNIKHEHLIEQQMRPLLTVMGIRPLYPFIFGSDDDFTEQDRISRRLSHLASEAADEAFKTLLSTTYKSLESFSYVTQPAPCLDANRNDEN